MTQQGGLFGGNLAGGATGGTGGGLFGGNNTQKPAGNIFGGNTAGNTAPQQGGGIFGGNNNTTQTQGAPTGGAPTGGIFGGGNPIDQKPLFGATVGNAANTTQPQNTGTANPVVGGGIFNNQQNANPVQGGGIFGQKPATNTPIINAGNTTTTNTTIGQTQNTNTNAPSVNTGNTNQQQQGQNQQQQQQQQQQQMKTDDVALASEKLNPLVQKWKRKIQNQSEDLLKIYTSLGESMTQIEQCSKYYENIANISQGLNGQFEQINIEVKNIEQYQVQIESHLDIIRGKLSKQLELQGDSEANAFKNPIGEKIQGIDFGLSQIEKNVNQLIDEMNPQKDQSQGGKKDIQQCLNSYYQILEKLEYDTMNLQYKLQSVSEKASTEFIN